MSWTLIASTNVAVAGTTSAVNTTGADLIVINSTAFSAGSSTPTDSPGNTYTSAASIVTTRENCAIFFVHNPTTSATHTFTLGGGPTWMDVQVWSGSIVGTTLDQTNSGKSGVLGSTTVQPGSITPTTSGQLLVCALSLDDPSTTLSPTINSGFTVSTFGLETAGVRFGSAFAYLVQSAAAAINPTWTRQNAGTNSAGQDGAVIASFKAAPSSYVPYNPYQNAPGYSPILAQHHKSTGWTPNQDHRWRRQRSGILTPVKKLILPKAA